MNCLWGYIRNVDKMTFTTSHLIKNCTVRKICKTEEGNKLITTCFAFHYPLTISNRCDGEFLV